MNKYEVLQNYFGYAAFREGQEKLIDAILTHSDVMGIMPTGGGKSICYQVPALLFPGITVVISPLISLMKDQVMSLKTAGVAAAYLNSSLTLTQQRQVCENLVSGRYKLLYVAPERLESPDFLQVCQQIRISLVAVDEAHCISQWGQDFRPSYLKISDYIARLPTRPVVAAFTATATEIVRKDIVRLLKLWEPIEVVTGFNRPNLYFEVRTPKSKSAELLAILAQQKEKSGIVYCMTRKLVETVCETLQSEGLSATRYHAGLSEEERHRNQEDFLYDRAQIMVATTAFGMGIDKSNVSYVIHYTMPLSIESYYQEAGRAGRDGSPAECILLYSPGDLRRAKELINRSGENELLSPEEREEVLRCNRKRLEDMQDYCRTTDCLRGYILRYFGQEHGERCNHCSNCSSDYTSQDISTEAQMILSCIKRVQMHLGYSVGKALIARILLGSRDKRIMENGLNQLSTYGLMKDYPRARINEMIDSLIMQGAIEADPAHNGIILTSAAQPILLGQRSVTAKFKELPQRSSKKTILPETSVCALYDRLRWLRLRIAQAEDVPAFVIFSNQTLHDMSAKRPLTFEELLEVSGIGKVKAQRYGAAFLNAIREYLEQTDAL